MLSQKVLPPPMFPAALGPGPDMRVRGPEWLVTELQPRRHKSQMSGHAVRLLQLLIELPLNSRWENWQNWSQEKPRRIVNLWVTFLSGSSNEILVKNISIFEDSRSVFLQKDFLNLFFVFKIVWYLISEILHVRLRFHHKNIVCQFEVKQSQDVILFQHWVLTSIIIHTLMSDISHSLLSVKDYVKWKMIFIWKRCFTFMPSRQSEDLPPRELPVNWKR